MNRHRFDRRTYPIRQWINRYSSHDNGRPEEVDSWRRGEDGWMACAPRAGPYLIHIRALAAAWPSLEHLADFMDVGTTPLRWPSLTPLNSDLHRREREKHERMTRTNVCVMEYQSDGIEIRRCDDMIELRGYLSEFNGSRSGNETFLKLFVVDDLSRDVIEALGSHFDIDPSFFRAHVDDYIWSNVNDWWREPPNLDMVRRRQDWFQLRFIRQRYFKDIKAFNEGVKETESFNVYRQLRSDLSDSTSWDKGQSKIAGTRTKATLWMKSDRLHPNQTVAILLLDPSTTSGNPLWHAQNNWSPKPSSRSHGYRKNDSPPQGNLAQTFIHWARNPEAFHWSRKRPDRECSPICLPLQALLHIVCDEWLTLIDYISTRLQQIDFDLAFLDNMVDKEESIQESLRKLHHWRRMVPVYRKNVSEALSQISREKVERVQPNELDTSDHEEQTKGEGWTLRDCLDSDCIQAYTKEFQLILKHLEEQQEKLEHIISGALGIINVAEAMKSYNENKHLQYLTWLATIFIPLNFVATMLSMTEDPFQLGQSAKLWAKVALPSGLFTVLLVSLIRYPRQVKGSIRACYDKVKM